MNKSMDSNKFYRNRYSFNRNKTYNRQYPLKCERKKVFDHEWHESERDPNVMWMRVSAPLVTFAEAMRYGIERISGGPIGTFAEVITKGIPFYNKMSEADKEGWEQRARLEKRQNQCIYMRKNTTKTSGCTLPEYMNEEPSDCESDPDELPGEFVGKRIVYQESPPVKHAAMDPKYRFETMRRENRNWLETSYDWPSSKLDPLNNRNPFTVQPKPSVPPPIKKKIPKTPTPRPTIIRPPIPSVPLSDRAAALYQWNPVNRNIFQNGSTTSEEPSTADPAEPAAATETQPTPNTTTDCNEEMPSNDSTNFDPNN